MTETDIIFHVPCQKDARTEIFGPGALAVDKLHSVSVFVSERLGVGSHITSLLTT